MRDGCEEGFVGAVGDVHGKTLLKVLKIPTATSRSQQRACVIVRSSDQGIDLGLTSILQIY